MKQMLTCLGKYLRTFRIERGELLKDMADKLGLAPAYLSSIENGKRTPTKKFIDSIIIAYDFNEQLQKDLIDAYHMSLEEVSFSIKTVGDEQKNIGVAFARKFNSLNEIQIRNIRSILEEVKS